MMPAEQIPPEWCLSALVAGWLGVEGGTDRPITGLSRHAQAVQPGELFLATAGIHTHGLCYLDEAVERGAAAVLWEPTSDFRLPPQVDQIPLLALESLGRHVGPIADRFYGRPSQQMQMIGVTGTDGKTSVSQFIAQALHEPQAPCGVLGTLGYGLYGQTRPGAYTTPEALQLQSELQQLHAVGASRVTMEVSSHALQQGRVNGVAFDIAVLTHLGRDHFDYHGTVEAYKAAKRRLFEMPGLSQAVLNFDDAFGCELAAELSGQIEVLGYGLDAAAQPAVRGSKVRALSEGLRMEVTTPAGSGTLASRLLGRFNAGNLLAALATLLQLGIPLPRALERLSGIHPVPGRLEAFPHTGRPRVVVDYAHTPRALGLALTALQTHCRGRLWCVFGCGGDRDAGKRPLMAYAAERFADRVVVTDDNPRHEPAEDIVAGILKGFSHPAAVTVIHDRARAIEHALRHSAADDLVLIAGKGHETVQLIGDDVIPFSDREFVATLLEQATAWVG